MKTDASSGDASFCMGPWEAGGRDLHAEIVPPKPQSGMQGISTVTA